MSHILYISFFSYLFRSIKNDHFYYNLLGIPLIHVGYFEITHTLYVINGVYVIRDIAGHIVFIWFYFNKG